MILDEVCYSVIHFCRVILYLWRSSFIVSLSWSFSDEYLVIFTSIFVSGCLQMPVSPLQCYVINNKPPTSISSSQDYQPFPLARVH